MNSLRLVPVLVFTFLSVVVSAGAVNRTLVITAPAAVKPGTNIHVVIAAATDAADAERIGFFHAEHSADGGRTWVPVYAEKLGHSATREINIPAGAEGTKALVRVRIAFRGGKAGDVDFAGAPINWGGSWSKWESPPAKTATINVMVR